MSLISIKGKALNKESTHRGIAVLSFTGLCALEYFILSSKKLIMRNPFLPALNPKKRLPHFLTSNMNKTVYIKRYSNNRNFDRQEGGA